MATNLAGIHVDEANRCVERELHHALIEIVDIDPGRSLRALGLEACDRLSEMAEGSMSVEAANARASADRIRKELTR